MLIWTANIINLLNLTQDRDNALVSDRVYIFDTTLRDGEQSPGCSMTVPEKLKMARKLVELGVDILEAGFPIASEGDFQAVDAVSREFPWAQVAALARCCTLDVERAAKSLEHAKRPRIHTFIATSPIHLKFKLKKSEEQVLEEAVAAVELARTHVDDVEFSAEDGARTEPEFLEKISRAVVAAGARTVNIPDTVGYSTPREYGALIGQVARALGDCAVVSVHCHDDLGLAVANSLAGIEAGCRLSARMQYASRKFAPQRAPAVQPGPVLPKNFSARPLSAGPKMKPSPNAMPIRPIRFDRFSGGVMSAI